MSIPLVLLTSLFVFVLVASATDPLGRVRDQPDVSSETVEALSADLHLDEPVLTRYGRWLSGAVRGDLGKSLDGRDVGGVLWERMQVTMRMVTLATLIAVALGLTVGMVGAVRQYSRLDHVLTFVSYMALSLPLFWVAGLFKEYLAIRLNRVFGAQWIFTVGEADPNLTGTLWQRLGNHAGHLILPTLALVLAPAAVWGRYLRASMLEVLSADYIRTARAKGLSSRRVIVRHALRNALAPFVTLVGLHFGHLLAGAVIIERVFAWQGMGQLLLDGVHSADVNIVSAWLLVTATMVFACSLLTDVAYRWLDPRVDLA